MWHKLAHKREYKNMNIDILSQFPLTLSVKVILTNVLILLQAVMKGFPHVTADPRHAIIMETRMKLIGFQFHISISNIT